MIQIPMIASKWNWDSYSTGMVNHPIVDGAGWKFSFPPKDGVHYLTTHVPATGIWPFSLFKTMDFSSYTNITVEGEIDQIGSVTPDFVAAGGGTPAMRLLIERSIDVNRYWSNPVCLTLSPGSFKLVVPLTSDQWSDVNGHSGTQTLSTFNNLLRHVGVVGMTFGGYFFGHGVWLTQGHADFHCRSYTVS